MLNLDEVLNLLSIVACILKRIFHSEELDIRTTYEVDLFQL